MTNDEQELLRILSMLRDCHRHNGIPKGWHYDGPGDFLLREARFYRPAAAPVAWEASLPNACFRNAGLYASLQRLHYVEGYALGVIPTHHGWCADDDGKVIEVSWNFVGSLYFGVEFDPWKLQRGSVLFNEVNASIYRRRYKPPPAAH
jgi:hypothetical protein